jgi:hypothetical protein
LIEEGKIKMGTAWLLTANAIQAFGIKTILGSFFVVFIVLGLHAIYTKSYRSSMVSYLLIAGVIVVGSLVMLCLAVDAMAQNSVSGTL